MSRSRPSVALVLVLAALLGGAARPALGAEAPYPAAVLGDHPTSYWRLGERPGTTIAANELDRFPGWYVGPPALGVVHPLSGDPDTAIDLDGLTTQPLGQYLHVPDAGHLAFAGRAPFSLEAWVHPRAFNDVTRRIFSKEGPDGGYLLGVRREGLIFSRYAHGQWSTLATGVDAHRWSHVLATYDGTVMSVYIDGWLSASEPSSISLPASAADLSIGAKQSRWRFYAGGLDELAIYPYAVSAGRALAHSRIGGDVR